MHGILLLDKPVNITSNAALQVVKRLYQARKAGHTGSLDPFASGLLPICLGEATKIAGFLLDKDKCYRALCKLGITTSTGDTEGDILEVHPPGVITRQLLTEVLAGFTGEIEQVPPMFSAIKQQGQPLYKLARRGISVERQARRVTIHKLVLLSYNEDLVEIEVQCTKGTYIRTLAEDIGARLGCGAHLQALRRIGLGDFQEAQMVTLDQLSDRAASGTAPIDSLLISMQAALADWPDVNLTDDAAFYLGQGQIVSVAGNPGCGRVKLYAPEGRFLGLGEVLQDGRVAPKRLLHSG
ncbi:MAG: tRNA pseudouridine(55) synthase TruB [Gammaproteobacteria bacterium]